MRRLSSSVNVLRGVGVGLVDPVEGAASGAVIGGGIVIGTDEYDGAMNVLWLWLFMLRCTTLGHCICDTGTMSGCKCWCVVLGGGGIPPYIGSMGIDEKLKPLYSCAGDACCDVWYTC